MPQRRRREWPAAVAAGLAFASAAVSLYWTAGGTALLDTVGGEIERLARDRSAGGLALGLAAVLLKAAAGVVALGLRRRAVIVAGAVAAGVLTLWGAANVAVGALVLAGAITPSGAVDRHALRWHVFLWDMWFLVWGVVLAVAVRRAWLARRRCTSSTSR